jgi:hypothetical protein
MVALQTPQGRSEILLMIHHLFNCRRAKFALLTVLAVGLWPHAADAAVLAFRNETDSPIMVQGITIINRVARRGKLHLIGPGEVSQEPILVPGFVQITVIDAKQPNHALCQKIIQFTGTDLFFAIQREQPEKLKEGEDPPRSKGRKTLAPKVKLVPAKPVPQAPKPSR